MYRYVVYTVYGTHYTSAVTYGELSVAGRSYVSKSEKNDKGLMQAVLILKLGAIKGTVA
jgi:hypothetical protein